MVNSIFQKFSFVLLLLSVIIVAACGGETNNETETTVKESDAALETSAQRDTSEAKLNINTASGDEFRTMPNVGDEMVHEFEEYRPYTSIQQFRKEIGKYVDEAQVAEYEQYIYVPIHRNDSDIATLMQIPGLDEGEAEKLDANRPFENNQAFFDALASYVNKDGLEKAKVYIKTESTNE